MLSILVSKGDQYGQKTLRRGRHSPPSDPPVDTREATLRDSPADWSLAEVVLQMAAAIQERSLGRALRCSAPAAYHLPRISKLDAATGAATSSARPEAESKSDWRACYTSSHQMAGGFSTGALVTVLNSARTV